MLVSARVRTVATVEGPQEIAAATTQATHATQRAARLNEDGQRPALLTQQPEHAEHTTQPTRRAAGPNKAQRAWMRKAPGIIKMKKAPVLPPISLNTWPRSDTSCTQGWQFSSL